MLPIVYYPLTRSKLRTVSRHVAWATAILRDLGCVAASSTLLFTTACGGAGPESNTPKSVAAPVVTAPPRCGDTQLESEPGTTYYYVSPNGNDRAAGSCDQPMATLQAVENKIRDGEGVKLEAGWPTKTLANSYTVYVRGGTYSKQHVAWHAASADPTKWVQILAYPGERPVFDGEGKVTEAFDLLIGRAVVTNFRISGLTWRRYRNGIHIQGRKPRGGQALWTGGGTISDNVFEEIGDVYDRGECKDFKKRNKDNQCFGSSVIGLGSARHNIVERNIVVRAESLDTRETFGGGSRAVMHGLYISGFSHDNIIRDNYFELVSGDPINLRWGSSNNQIYRNYALNSGQKAFVGCWFNGAKNAPGAPCMGNIVQGNAFLFGYPWTDSKRSRCVHPVPETRAYEGSRTVDARKLLVNQGNVVYSSDRPRTETIGGLTTGDLDGDGVDEVIVALNYGTQFSTVVSTDGRTPYLSRLVHAAPTSPPGYITGLAAGRFDGSARDQLVVAWQRLPPAGRAEVWRGDGALLMTGTNGANNLGEVWSSDGRVVDSLAAGDFDGDGGDELMIGLRSGPAGPASVYHGDGTERGSRVFGPDPSSFVRAMATGDLDGDGRDELFAAFVDSATQNTVTVYRGDGEDSVDGEVLFKAGGTVTTALTTSPATAGNRALYGAFAYPGARSAEIRYQATPAAAPFADVLEQGAPGTVVTHLVFPNSTGGKPVRAIQSPKQNVILDGQVTYHRWDQPTGKIHCDSP